MVEIQTHAYTLTMRFIYLAAILLLGNLIGQATSFAVIYWAIYDSQAAGMLIHIIMQKMSYLAVLLSFILLGFANLLVKRQLPIYKRVRAPLLGLLLCSAIPSIALIPRMDYLREFALSDGLPVMASPLAGYFLSLNLITALLFITQLFMAFLVVLRLRSLP
ncbi:hypothetical protein SAMN06295945_0410 [Polynucleobacter meluiroseus]|uniref:Uncharacterized protein n=1 Tax=Polynucleobacter meluiroseus TaxID=1938814 RepID=A0A240DZN8_9BURK|nr:hypothetical protein [Polynucleobacter meluiroseus]SNX28090.1 hypothetical protein SAMN06295945_0410 [Polynucleobacter meluiroseus]